uniref:Large ribosomal subunit protein mL52 n=1 Tax=Anas platyrhynchos platyrhynchos TaxID=8840 RepID=A0A493T541_ANAPP
MGAGPTAGHAPFPLAPPPAELQARALQPSPAPSRGLAPSQSGPGPLRDLPDWSFADGRPAPLWRGQQRRRREDEALAVSGAAWGPRGGGRAGPGPPAPPRPPGEPGGRPRRQAPPPPR